MTGPDRVDADGPGADRVDPERVDPERLAPERLAPERLAPERAAPERAGPGRVDAERPDTGLPDTGLPDSGQAGAGRVAADAVDASGPSDRPVPAARGALRLLAAGLVCAAAVALYVFLHRPTGYLMLAAGVGVAFAVDRHLFRHLALIATSLAIISTMSLAADLSNAGMARFAVVLSLAVAVPFLVLRYVLREDVIAFPWRTGQRWSRFEYTYLIVVVALGYLVLPPYFIGSGAYRNWPTVVEPGEIARLFLGVNAVGLWDELFFICTVFALLRRHFPFGVANVLQSVVFVSFLWELGYRSWGPALTIPFALLQGYIFARTRSLTYVVTVHLSFDLIIFMILVNAHTPTLFDVFVTAPR